MSDTEALSFLRDEQGRFAPKDKGEAEPSEPAAPIEATPEPEANPEPAAAATPAPAAPPASPQEPAPEPAKPEVREPHSVPIAAILDEREKRQALQRELEEFKRKYEEATKQQQEPIDPISDPDGFRTHFEQQLARTRWDTITTMSRNWAVKNHGQADVDAAEEAVKAEIAQNPGFFQTIQSQPDPYDFAVRWHKRKQFTDGMSELSPEEWLRKKALEMGFIDPKTAAPVEQAAPVAGTEPPQPVTLPKPSLASAPAATGTTPKIPIGEGIAFGEAFN